MATADYGPAKTKQTAFNQQFINLETFDLHGKISNFSLAVLTTLSCGQYSGQYRKVSV